MKTRDMAEIVETFRTKFMEGAAGIAGRVAGACAGLVATPGGLSGGQQDHDRTEHQA